MSEEGNYKLWRLYDSAQKSFYNELNLIQLSKVISEIPEGQMGSWYVCENGQADWTPLADKLPEFEKVDTTERATTFVGLITEPADAVPAFNVKALIRDLQTVEKRMMGRIKTEIPVFVDVGAQILRANTSDISVMGLKLDQDFAAQYKLKYYPLILKTNPIINLRGMPLQDATDQQKQTWNRMKIHPDFGLHQLADFLSKLEK